jgi:hypothetical protein
MSVAATMAQTQPATAVYQQGYQAGSQSLLNQQLQTLDAGTAPRAAMAVGRPRAEVGKPYSATVVTQTTQTFADGTHVSQTDTLVQYRDAEGRTRDERPKTNRGAVEIPPMVMIRDPVAGTSYQVDPVNKTAVKLVTAGIAVAGGGGGGGGGGVAVAVGGGGGARGGVITQGGGVYMTEVARKNPNNLVEDLGTTMVNGVPAQGTRVTTVVPAGAIGNDREFRSTSERWFSPDLNLMVKSVNTDPRFGTTVHEMTNISRLPPDPALFTVPGDYKIVSRAPQF